MPDDLKTAYLQIAESLSIASRELEKKASILRSIETALHHQASISSRPDLIHSVNPENLFEIIRKSILRYEKHK